MDAHEQLAMQSAVCAGVLGRGEDFVLIRLDVDYPGKQEAIECALGRGLRYCGALGWGGGKMSVALEPEPETLKPLRFAAFAFGALVAAGGLEVPPAQLHEAEPVQHGDSVAWCNHLFSLPDTRN